MAQIPDKILYVSPDFKENVVDHEYNDLQRAIDSIPDWGRYMIMLCDNFTDVPTLRLRADNISVKFNGQTEYGIIFKTDEPIVTMENGQTLKFSDMTYVRGEEINVNVASGFGFYNCESVIAKIIVDQDGRVYIHNTKIYGMYGEPVIETGKNANLTIRNSFVRGGYRSPAINFTYELLDKVKISNSIILHYDGIDNYPLVKSDGFKVSIRAYNCVGQNRLCSRDIINLINIYNNNIVDPKITF